MGYKYRARIETAVRRHGFLWLSKGPCYRYVIERHFVEWEDKHFGYWTPAKGKAERCASSILDAIERKPKGEYLHNGKDHRS